MTRNIVTCPTCGSKFDVSKFAVGAKVKCGKCSGVLTVPAVEAPKPEAPPAARPPAPPKRPEPSLTVAHPSQVGVPVIPFRDADHARLWLTRRLERAVPPGWRLESGDTGRSRLEWRLVQEGGDAGRSLDEDFGIWLTKGLDFLVVSHGNTDGLLTAASLPFVKATLLDCRMIENLELGPFLARLVADETPNRWGCS